jgi:hypothetical protein
MLWAYPGPYRRRHGAEIVTTLLEMAESGHGWPAMAQALHLMACGVRQRFRLPAGRPLALVAAVLAAIALGAFGAAGGTWLGWQTAASVPSGDEACTLTAALAGGDRSDVAVHPWTTAMGGPVVGTRTTGEGSTSADRVRTALASAGWRITTSTETTGRLAVNLAEEVEVPTRGVQFAATKDGLALTGDSMTVVGGAEYGLDGRVDQRLDVWAVETGAVRRLTIAGLLAGMLTGWLVTSALAGRVRQSGPAYRSAVTALGATAVAAAIVPTVDLYGRLHRVLSYDTGAPNPYIVDGPGGHLPAGLVLAGTGVALLALAAAALLAVRGTRTGSGPAGPEPVALN